MRRFYRREVAWNILPHRRSRFDRRRRLPPFPSSALQKFLAGRREAIPRRRPVAEDLVDRSGSLLHSVRLAAQVGQSIRRQRWTLGRLLVLPGHETLQARIAAGPV